MFRFLIFIMIMLGLGWMVICADQQDWPRQIWNRMNPKVHSPRPLTHAEVWVMELENRITNLQQEIQSIEEQCILSQEYLRKLAWQLKQRIGFSWVTNVESNLSNDPIVISLESTIDNEDRHNEELTARILDLKTEQARLKTKLASITVGKDALCMSYSP